MSILTEGKDFYKQQKQRMIKVHLNMKKSPRWKGLMFHLQQKNEKPLEYLVITYKSYKCYSEYLPPDSEWLGPPLNP